MDDWAPDAAGRMAIEELARLRKKEERERLAHTQRKHTPKRKSHDNDN